MVDKKVNYAQKETLKSDYAQKYRPFDGYKFF